MSSLPHDPADLNTATAQLKLSQDDISSPRSIPHPGLTNPLSDAHFDELRWASKRAKAIEKAVRYASFSGWTTLLAGALSLPFALGKPSMMIFALVIAGIGTRELTLCRSLRVLDSKAPKRLAINQVLLAASLSTYAIFMLMSPAGEGMVESAMKTDPMLQSTPELSGMFDDMIQLEHLATAIMYVMMIVIAVFIQGGTAMYYLLKGSKLKKMHKETPDWAVRVYQTLQ